MRLRPYFYSLLLILSFISTQCTTDQKTHYSIGRDPAWYPHPDIWESQIGPMNGFLNALVQHISKIEKTPIDIQNIDSLQLMPIFEAGRVEGIFSTANPTLETLNKYDFSDPILLFGPVLVVRNHSNYCSLEDLSGKLLGIDAFDNSVLIAQKYDVVIKQYEDMPLALEDLAQGKIDGLLLANLKAQALVPTQYAETLHITTAPLNDEGLRLITKKEENSSLLALFNRGLQKLRRNGTFSRLRQEFLLTLF